jgi:hypothetical protein
MNFAIVMTTPKAQHWYQIQRLLQSHAVKDIWLLPESYAHYIKDPWHHLHTDINTDLPYSLTHVTQEAVELLTIHRKRPIPVLMCHYHKLYWEKNSQVYLWHDSELYHPLSPMSVGVADTFSFDHTTQHLSVPLIDDHSDCTQDSFYYVLIQQKRLTQPQDQTPHKHQYHVNIQALDSSHKALSETYELYI